MSLNNQIVKKNEVLRIFFETNEFVESNHIYVLQIQIRERILKMVDLTFKSNSKYQFCFKIDEHLLNNTEIETGLFIASLTKVN